MALGEKSGANYRLSSADIWNSMLNSWSIKISLVFTNTIYSIIVKNEIQEQCIIQNGDN